MGLDPKLVEGVSEAAKPARASLAANAAQHSARGSTNQIRCLSLLISDLVCLVLACWFAQEVSSFLAKLFGSSAAFEPSFTAITEHSGHKRELLLLFAVFCFQVGARGHYTHRVPYWTEVKDVTLAAALAFFIDVTLWALLLGSAPLPALALRFLSVIVFVLGGRHLTLKVLRIIGVSSVRTIVMGEAGSAKRLTAALESEASLGYELVAEIRPEAIREYATTDSLLKLLMPFGADLIVFASPLALEQEANLVATADRMRISVAIMPATPSLPVSYGRPHYFFSHDVMLLARQSHTMKPVGQAMKLTLDMSIAAAMLIFFAPAMGLIAILIRLDGGPTLFRHKRLGANMRVFPCMKFRTMHVNGDAILAKHLANDPAAAAEWAAIRKLHNDPRVTLVGRFLRKTSLDELPQLINVLRGEMSLVGPRPIVTSEVSLYGSNIDYYSQTKPGLTGLWQVSGRNNTSYPKRVQLDVWYVKNWSFWHDIVILMKTVPAVLLRRGAQ